MCQVWWELRTRYMYSSQNSKSDHWPWSDLDLWPIQKPVPSDECQNSKSCSYKIWSGNVWNSARYSVGRTDGRMEGRMDRRTHDRPRSSSQSCFQLRLGTKWKRKGFSMGQILCVCLYLLFFPKKAFSCRGWGYENLYRSKNRSGLYVDFFTIDKRLPELYYVWF